MAMSKRVVIGGSDVTAGQLKDFFSKIADGTIGYENLDGYLREPNKFSPNDGSLTIVRAISILGKKQVVTAEQASRAWGNQVSQNVVIPYSEEDLRLAAKQNRTGKTKWHLVYCNGLSLREQREIIGTDQSHQPCFYNNDWWLNEKEDKWAKLSPSSDYYLLDFQGRFANQTWQEQEKAINKLGGERANEAVVAEAVFSIFKTYNKRLSEDWYHWGSFLTSDGYRVHVGLFDYNGFNVDRRWSGNRHSDLRVVLVWKFKNEL